ncbi:MAG TPA: D-erythronate dehydrogenase [Gaiellaceae bacterium]|jgi:nucleoside-diphosphate-sugar epimerase|nr:D-erythronate dehydrogenase [Gaiellaceae bacterium]
MRVLVTGAAGMVGRKLVERLARDGAIDDEPVSQLTVVDIAAGGPVEAPFPVEQRVADVAAVAPELVAGRPDLVFHLAAVVSGHAEADPDEGHRANVEGTRALFDAVRDASYCPRVVFSSSIAVFGPPFPDVIGDDQTPTPRTSYGTQKAIGELLLSDATRRGALDGVALRLPTICVRPGAPNRAASGFFSSIVREPLNGQKAVLPVPESTRHWFASPRSAVGFLLHAATLDATPLGDDRCLTMPGVSATVADEIKAVRAVGGDDAVALIRHEPDATIARIVSGWPRAFEARRALELGFRAERNFAETVDVYVQDELQQAVA